MLIALRKSATIKPATLAAIQAATGRDCAPTVPSGLSRDIIRKWRRYQGVRDASHTPHRFSTTLSAGPQERVVHLRQRLRLPLDDLLAVIREFIELSVSRSALARLLRWREVPRLPELEVTPQRTTKAFKADESGCVHADVNYLPQMRQGTKRRYLFVVIDRPTRWIFIAIRHHRTATAAWQLP